MAVSTALPLFPLGSVLVPGLVLPLHVFEHRYRVLVQALMALPEDAIRVFGVVAIRSGRDVGTDGARALYSIGCTAELRDVTPLDDGRFDIVSVGQSRFRLTGLDAEAKTPYHTGMVEFLNEPDGDADTDNLALAVAARFTAYRARLGAQPTEMPDDPRVLSYLVAAATLLDLPDRQALLERPTTSERLELELALLRRELTLIDAFNAVPGVDLASNPGN